MEICKKRYQVSKKKSIKERETGLGSNERNFSEWLMGSRDQLKYQRSQLDFSNQSGYQVKLVPVRHYNKSMTVKMNVDSVDSRLIGSSDLWVISSSFSLGLLFQINRFCLLWLFLPWLWLRWAAQIETERWNVSQHQRDSYSQVNYTALTVFSILHSLVWRCHRFLSSIAPSPLLFNTIQMSESPT